MDFNLNKPKAIEFEINNAKFGGKSISAVKSVNGKTGDVELNAADVGALPSDTPIPVYDDTEIREEISELDERVTTTSKDLAELSEEFESAKSEFVGKDELLGYTIDTTIPFYSGYRISTDGTIINRDGCVCVFKLPSGASKLTIKTVGVQIRGQWLKDYTDGDITNNVGTTIPNYISGMSLSGYTQADKTIPTNAKYISICTYGLGYNAQTCLDILKTNLSDEDIRYVKASKFTIIDNRLDALESAFLPTFTSILEFNNEIEIENNLVSALNNRNGGESHITYQNPCVCFGNVSDIHNQVGQLDRAFVVFNKFQKYISDIINCGDSESFQYTTSFDLYSKVSGAEKMLNVIGNHDACDDNQAFTITEEQCFANYMGFLPDSGAIYTTNHCYYYKDYTDSKLRLVVIDEYHFDTLQSSWFDEVLADAITKDYHVVVASHSAPSVVKVKYQSTFSAYSRNANIYRAEGLSNVETFIANGGHFVVWLCGHYHGIDFGTAENHPNVPILVCPTLWCNNEKTPDQIERVMNTKSQDFFLFEVIDTSNSLLKVFTVGVDKDKYLRSIKTMVFDYANKVVISNT